MARRMKPRNRLVTALRHPAGHLEAHALRGSGRHGEVIASFLQSDIQGDLDAARALLSAVGAAERGDPPLPATGNAFTVTVSGDGIELRNAVLADAAPEHYDFAEMRLALGTWIAAIERARRSTG
jgi:uncharacterized protein YacL (UPF0231 family)